MESSNTGAEPLAGADSNVRGVLQTQPEAQQEQPHQPLQETASENKESKPQGNSSALTSNAEQAQAPAPSKSQSQAQDPLLHRPGDRVELVHGRKYIFGPANVLVPAKSAWLDFVQVQEEPKLHFAAGTKVEMTDQTTALVAGVLALTYADSTRRRVQLVLSDGRLVCPTEAKPTGEFADDSLKASLQAIFEAECERQLKREPNNKSAAAIQQPQQSAAEGVWAGRLRVAAAASQPHSPSPAAKETPKRTKRKRSNAKATQSLPFERSAKRRKRTQHVQRNERNDAVDEVGSDGGIRTDAPAVKSERTECAAALAQSRQQITHLQHQIELLQHSPAPSLPKPIVVTAPSAQPAPLNTVTGVAQQLLQLQSAVLSSQVQNLQSQLLTSVCTNVLAAVAGGSTAHASQQMPALVSAQLTALQPPPLKPTNEAKSEK